jgi:hypothetical protein
MFKTFGMGTVRISIFSSLLYFLFSSSEEYRLRVSENRVLRRIFGSKRDEVTGGWGKTA